MILKKILPYLFFAIFFPPLPVFCATQNQIIEKIEQRYSNRSYRADFFQQSTLKALDIKQTAHGFVIFSHPGKMFWQYSLPKRQEIVTDGDKVWIYMHNNNQAMEGDAKDYFKEGMGGSFLSDIRKIKINYIVEMGKTKKQTNFLLILHPKKKGPVSKIEVLVLKENGKILRVKTTNQNNDDTILNFRNEEFIDNIDNKIFNFKIPKNAKITKISK